ncbi:hypothetical protein PVK06_023431 [Gossypium arboreum]|uniref:Uncharacterized protein n=1 Tax=Gossypium arboreum TaxID=29729 RepID=A0ABR0PB98_GOSAR|nr:hypothetical protein PVK06_023431 [Gossypium arboreum]
MRNDDVKPIFRQIVIETSFYAVYYIGNGTLSSSTKIDYSIDHYCLLGVEFFNGIQQRVTASVSSN